MDVLYPRCAGLDVHAQRVTACMRIAEGATVTRAEQTFGTTTPGLLALAEWLQGHGCTHVAMEATGVYWKPVWHVLEDQVELVLANAMHIRQVPGRKSDVNDARWIADLLAHGLIRSSFVPPTAIQAVRDLTRTRKQLRQEIARHTLRIQKTLEAANLRLTQVMSDVLGTSGRAVVQAVAAGEADPERLADLTTGRLRAGRPALVAALHGHATAHQRFLLGLHLRQVEALEAAITQVDAELTAHLAPFQWAVTLLTTMPGVGETVAQVLVGEIGVDMSRFPTAGHLVSWAGLCPRMDESAGKRRSTRVRYGAPWLKTTLVQAAWAAVRTKGSYLQAQFLRLKGRRGPKKAIVAVAASMLTAAYFMLANRVPYHDLGGRYFEDRDKQQMANRLLKRLRDLGMDVQIRAA